MAIADICLSLYLIFKIKYKLYTMDYMPYIVWLHPAHLSDLISCRPLSLTCDISSTSAFVCLLNTLLNVTPTSSL